MPSYYKIILSFIIIVSFTSCIKQINYSKQDYLKENIILSMAIDYEFNKNYENSANVYEQLFTKFHRFEYLHKCLTLNMYLNNYEKVKELSFNNIDIYESKEEYLMKNYTFASIRLKQYNDSLDMSLQLVDLNNSSNNYLFVADSYYGLKKYNLSTKYYEKAYLKDNNVKSLLNLSLILYGKLNKKKEAITYLETYNDNHNCNRKVCATLVKYYQESQNIDGVIKISTEMLDKYKNT